jgi:galactose oxidase
VRSGMKVRRARLYLRRTTVTTRVLVAGAVLVAVTGALTGFQTGFQSSTPVEGHGGHEHRPSSIEPVASDTSLPRGAWTVAADSAQEGEDPAAYAIDNNPNTIWHTQYAPTATPLPHTFTIDMHTSNIVTGLRYQPRLDHLNGNIGSYQIHVSANGTSWGSPVATGTFADDNLEKTIPITPTVARFVRLTALSEAGNRGPFSAAAEINVTGNPAPVLSRVGWTVAADSANTETPAVNAIDGNNNTLWHTQYAPTATPLPHTFTIDMHASNIVSGLRYQPRLDHVNGDIGGYQIHLSTDGVTWNSPVATGTFGDGPAEKAVPFAPTAARFVRLTALTEAGNRGPWSSAAEINLVGQPVPTLPRGAWTVATDSSQAGETPGIYAIDGNINSMWHTQYNPTSPALPHTYTIDMHATNIVTGLRYLPRWDNNNGDIGGYQIFASTNGTSWGSPIASGTWPDGTAEKTVTFNPVTTRFIRLTALTEAGNRGPWSSAAEINLVGGAPPPAANVGGSWGPTIGLPLIPVGAAQLPNGNVLAWSAAFPYDYIGGTGQTQTAILNVSNGTVGKRTVTETQHDMFCPGTVRLPDGRLMITGGNDAPKTSFYNPANDTWSSGPDMNIPRGYQANVTLSNGSVLTLGGSWNGGFGGKNGEVWSPATNSWRTLSGVPADPILTQDPEGVFHADNHAWLFALSDQRVFQAGPSKQMNMIDTKGNGTITPAGNRADDQHAMNGSAVMYDVGKILTIGGGQAYNSGIASNRAYTIDLNNGVTAQRTGDMAYGRAYTHAVALPDGKVLAVTGTTNILTFSDVAGVLAPELWDPATGKFTQLAPMNTPRTYHSTALLLPDGRVFVGGGGLCGPCQVNHPDAQIFSPPYLFAADGTPAPRPAITSAPGTMALGANVNVTTDRAVSSFSLVRMGSVTHSVNTDQRRIPLTASAVNGTTYTLPIPSDPGVTVPGYYMLFAMDAGGVPSVAATVKIG